MKRLLVLAATSVSLVCVAPATAVTVQIGSVAPDNGSGGCGTCQFLQSTTDPASPSYVVPPAPATGPWTLTAWSTRAPSTATSHPKLEIWRPTATAGQLELEVISDAATIPAGTAPEVPVSIPVLPGDVLGLNSEDEGIAVFSSAFSADVLLSVSSSVQGGTAGTPGSDIPGSTLPSELLNASATLTAPDPPGSTPTPTPEPAPEATPTVKKCPKKRKKAKTATVTKNKKKCRKAKKKR